MDCRRTLFLLLIMMSNCGQAAVIPGSKSGFDMVWPVMKSGIDSASGNWVDRNFVTWSKTVKPVADYESAKLECADKIKTDAMQWQLPTPEQAERFYRFSASKPNVFIKRGWVLGTIYLQSDATDKHAEMVDLVSGVLYLDGYTGKNKVFAQCVALPQGFDKAGNYFDGKLTWSKPTSKSYSIAEATKKCAEMNNNVQPRATGTWQLPTFEQLDASLAQPLQLSVLFRQKMKKNGWVFGTALVQSESRSGNYKLLYSAENSQIVTCVR